MRTNSCLKEILSGVSSKLDEIETTGEKKRDRADKKCESKSEEANNREY